MNTKNPTINSTEILNRIDRFTSDVDWTIEELRESLVADGIDPDQALENIKVRLAPFVKLKEPPTIIKDTVGEQHQASATILAGILATAAQIGLSKERLMELSGLSETLLIKLDRRLISLKGFSKIAEAVADALKTTKQTIIDYAEDYALYPAEANFKAESLPELPPKQEFAEAVKTDPLLSEKEKAHLLSLRDKD